MKFAKLFEPCMIGNLEVPNRIVFLPITSYFPNDGLVTEQMAGFYTEIARGGVVLLIVEDAIIDSPIGLGDNLLREPRRIASKKFFCSVLTAPVDNDGLNPFPVLHFQRTQSSLEPEAMLERDCYHTDNW